MKVELCSFSGFKIYPGHGKRMIKTDGKVFTFLNAKCEAANWMKRNPRKITWTVLYRRKHKKGLEEEQQKKKTRRTTKFQRAIVGASLTDIMVKRNMKPEVRKAQREQAIRFVRLFDRQMQYDAYFRAAKEKQRAQKASKKVPVQPAKGQKQAPKQKAAKVVQTKAPRVGGKR